jgi:hypothetical protein
MVAQRVADMTLEELKVLVEEIVDKRIQRGIKPRSTRSVKEINESIRRHRWTPPEGAPTNQELLREDRDR